MSDAHPRRRVPFLDIEVTPITLEQLTSAVQAAVAERRSLVISAHNLHSAYIYHTDSTFREFYRNSDLILVDGTPVLNLLRTTGPGASFSHRLGSTDWIAPISAVLSRVLILGASATSNAGAVEQLRKSAPATVVVGIPGNPWSEDTKANAIRTIQNFKPDLLLVGMGMPLQERVAAEMASMNDCRVIATVGGAIDQISGTQSLAPRWLGRFGAEWLWRLASDPRRLSYRYLVEPVKLIMLLARKRVRK